MIITGKNGTAKIFIEDIDKLTFSKIEEHLNSEIVKDEVVRIMPNIYTNGNTISGLTQTYKGNSISPSILGFNVGNSTTLLEIKKLDIEELSKLQLDIKDIIPINEIRKKIKIDIKDFRNFMKVNLQKERSYSPSLVKYKGLNRIDKFIEDTINRLNINEFTFYKSVGSLVNGFIEIGKSEINDSNYITIRANNSYVGSKVVSYWEKQISIPRPQKNKIKLAKKEINEKYIDDKQKASKEIKKMLRSNKFSILPSDILESNEDIQGYLEDIIFAQTYENYNRMIIVDLIKSILPKTSSILNQFASFSNYIDLFQNIIRVDSISACNNEPIVIPISESYGTVIGKGLGNIEWNNSCPSKIGRKLSKGQALKLFKSENAPEAFKDPAEILGLINGTSINLIDRIIPINSIK